MLQLLMTMIYSHQTDKEEKPRISMVDSFDVYINDKRKKQTPPLGDVDIALTMIRPKEQDDKEKASADCFSERNAYQIVPTLLTDDELLDPKLTKIKMTGTSYKGEICWEMTPFADGDDGEGGGDGGDKIDTDCDYFFQQITEYSVAQLNSNAEKCLNRQWRDALKIENMSYCELTFWENKMDEMLIYDKLTDRSTTLLEDIQNAVKNQKKDR